MRSQRIDSGDTAPPPITRLKSTVTQKSMSTTTFPAFMYIAFLLLCLSHTSSAAFTMRVCDYFGDSCVQENTNGTWCFFSTVVAQSTNCSLPLSVPLAAHLKQDFSIAYYAPTGQRLGGVNYSVPTTTLLYLCLSAEVGPSQYYTACGQVSADNTFGSNCAVSVAPSPVSDGCYGVVCIF